MGFSKIFKTETEKTYWSVAQGSQEIDYRNFEDILYLLPSKDTMLMSKNAMGQRILKSLRYLGAGPDFFTGIKVFLNTPQNFNKNTIKFSSLESALEDTKQNMSDLNTLYGHYSVIVSMVHFLIKRGNYYLIEKEKMDKNYAELLLKYEDLKKKTETSVNNASANTGEILIKSKEEKEEIKNEDPYTKQEQEIEEEELEDNISD